MIGKKPRFFFRRSQKVIVPGKERQIIIPFRGISVFAIFILLASSIYLIFRSDLFLVHQVKVDGEIKDCSTEDEVVRNLDVLGRSLVFLNGPQSATRLQSAIACIGEVIVKKNWPDKVRVEIRPRKGIALLAKIESTEPIQEATTSAQATLSAGLEEVATPSAFGTSQSHDLFLVDGGGFIFKKITSSSAYPKIDIAKRIDFKIGNQIRDQATLTAISFLALAPSFDFKILNGQIDQKDKIIIFLDDGTQVILAKDKEARNQAASLQAIAKQAKIEGEKIKSVDFNFDKPVLQVVKGRTKI
jgi:cell division septal protein FtsQ